MKLAVNGATGRMGQALIRALAKDPQFALAAALVRPDCTDLGADAGSVAGAGTLGVALTADPAAALHDADLTIDFSTPAACRELLDAALAANKGLVIGTTGFSAEDLDAIRTAADRIPVVLAPNMSVGVNLTFKLVEMAARALGDSVDVEVLEAHHSQKVDAPSGTALKLGEILATALNRDLERDAVYGRHGITGARERRTIGFSVLRGGDIVGEHTVMFAGLGERLEITHRAQSRDNFVAGALRAAEFLADRSHGLFDMQDVLGLS